MPNYFSSKNRILVLLLYFFSLSISQGQVWDSCGTDLRGVSSSANVLNNKLYVSIRDSVDNVYLFNIGVWDGVHWDTLGMGVDGAINASTVYNNKLFFGGFFDFVNGPSPGPPGGVFNFTSWDGTQFSDLGYPGMADWINALYTYKNEVYLGFSGSPLNINGQIYSGIVKFNDTIYSDVGGGVFHSFREVISMAEYNGKLIVAGRFDLAGTLPVNNIASWDGNLWQNVGNGLNYYVRALCVDTVNNILYAGGSFSHSFNSLDTIQTNYISKFDGTNWSSLGNGLGGTVTSLCMYKGSLYAATPSNSGQNPSWLMRWDGSNWFPVLPTPNNKIYSLNVYQNQLYVGGQFNEIDGIPYGGIARYSDTTTVDLNEIIISNSDITFYPNPVIENIIIDFSNHVVGTLEMNIYNSKGDLVLIRNYKFVNKSIELTIPKNWSKGLYFCKLIYQDKTVSKTFILK